MWPRYLTFPRPPDYTIEQGGDVYMYRWWVIPRNRLFNIYLHKFMRSDDDRALHDHPWVNCSIIVKGDYLEVLPIGAGALLAAAHMRTRPIPNVRLRRRFRPVFRRATAAHRVVLFPNSPPVWSLFLTGPLIRNWGFHCPQGWRPHQEFVKIIPGGNTVGKGCD